MKRNSIQNQLNLKSVDSLSSLKLLPSEASPLYFEA